MKQFLLIGNMNAITYKEVFPLIKSNQVWMGFSISGGDREFEVPDSYPLMSAGWRVDDNGKRFLRVKGVRWFTNIDHGRRHEPLQLMTMADNLKYSKHKEIKGAVGYQKYDNYDAIEVPYTDAIPSDCEGVMGVPISFLDKYCPEQFEIIGGTANGQVPNQYKSDGFKTHHEPILNGIHLYQRILIQHRKGANKQFLLIGNRNAITYKEVFPLIKENNMWLGYKQHSGNSMYFTIADKEYAKQISTEKAEGGWWRYINNEIHIAVNCCWFTNIDHGRRHKPLQLMTMGDNLKFSKHKEIKGSNGYQRHDNYDAIEVPYTDAIPSDYDGVMGVPISFLDKYCPEQFEIIGASNNGAVDMKLKLPHFKSHNEPFVNGQKIYQRIFIRHRKEV
jgi:hypothetical protein